MLGNLDALLEVRVLFAGIRNLVPRVRILVPAQTPQIAQDVVLCVVGLAKEVLEPHTRLRTMIRLPCIGGQNRTEDGHDEQQESRRMEQPGLDRLPVAEQPVTFPPSILAGVDRLLGPVTPEVLDEFLAPLRTADRGREQCTSGRWLRNRDRTAHPSCRPIASATRPVRQREGEAGRQ